MIALAPLLIGCVNDPDHRLVNMAERNLTTQARQNEQMAQQSQLVVEASRDLVAKDAQARQEMVTTQAKLQAAIQADRVIVAQQRDALELERQAIAHARQRDPIIAAAISSLGILLACILPLLLAGYILYCVTKPSDDHAILNELLITDLASDQPRLLPVSNSTPRIEHRADSPEHSDNANAP